MASYCLGWDAYNELEAKWLHTGLYIVHIVEVKAKWLHTDLGGVHTEDWKLQSF